MRIATFNLHHGKPNETSGLTEPGTDSLDGLATELSHQDLDVIALQEVDMEKSRSGKLDQGAYLAGKLGMNHVYAPSAFGYGVAILSRYEITKSRYLRLPQPTPIVFRDPEGERGFFGWQVRWLEPRVALYACLKVNGQDVLVSNTHLDIHNMTARNQLQVVADGFQRLEQQWGIEPVARIIAGDFNLAPDEVRQALGKEPMSQGAINVARRTGWKGEIPQATSFAEQFELLHEEATYPSSAPKKQIDHILGLGLTATSGGSIVCSVSDHALLVVNASEF